MVWLSQAAWEAQAGRQAAPSVCDLPEEDEAVVLLWLVLAQLLWWGADVEVAVTDVLQPQRPQQALQPQRPQQAVHAVTRAHSPIWLDVV